jgi:hypothetical protein
MKERKEMEIVRNETNEEVYFSKLSVGDIFVTANGNPNTYLKIEETYAELSGGEIESLLEDCMDADELDNHRYNAISLNDMQYHYFADFDEVIFKPSKLIVE